MSVSEGPTEGSAATSGTGRELLAILLGGAVALLSLMAIAGGRKTDFEDLALGPATKSYFARYEGYKIHCRGRFEDAQECIAGLQARAPEQGAALWLGNSQLHSINEMEEGQETATAMVTRRLRSRGIDLISISRGNNNPEEHLVWFAYLSSTVPLHALVLPVVFSSLRKSGVDPTIAPVLKAPGTTALLKRSEIGRKILAESEQWADNDLAALNDTVQERSESVLVDWLERHWRLWASREEARGTLFNFTRRFRNTVLGIEPTTKRRMLPGGYERNMAALAATLELARGSGVRVLVYVAPIRDDVALPYVESEYARFKVELKQLAEENGALFEDLGDLVPAEDWGQNDNPTHLGDEAEIDFMHFQEGGHQLLAQRVTQAFENGGLWTLH